MHLHPGICLLALSFIPGFCAPIFAQTHTVLPAIWRMDDTAKIGGQSTTILGQPHVFTEPTGKSVRFDGTADGLIIPLNPLEGRTQFTIEVLFKPAHDGPAEQRFLHLQDTLGNRSLLELRLTKDGWSLDTFLFSPKNDSRRALLDLTKRHEPDRWTWVALVYADGHMAHFINGMKEISGEVNFPPMIAGQISLGVRQNKVSWFKGDIREVRFHAVALPAEKLQHVSAE